MSKKLYVGNLSWGTNDESLREMFASYGDISEAKVITDRDTGRSRGFGFVTFENGDAADAAVSALDGTEVEGRPIRVNVAHDRRDR